MDNDAVILKEPNNNQSYVMTKDEESYLYKI